MISSILLLDKATIWEPIEMKMGLFPARLFSHLSFTAQWISGQHTTIYQIRTCFGKPDHNVRNDNENMFSLNLKLWDSKETCFESKGGQNSNEIKFTQKHTPFADSRTKYFAVFFNNFRNGFFERFHHNSPETFHFKQELIGYGGGGG